MVTNDAQRMTAVKVFDTRAHNIYIYIFIYILYPGYGIAIPYPTQPSPHGRTQHGAVPPSPTHSAGFYHFCFSRSVTHVQLGAVVSFPLRVSCVPPPPTLSATAPESRSPSTPSSPLVSIPTPRRRSRTSANSRPRSFAAQVLCSRRPF
jgi:hypothetical protein